MICLISTDQEVLREFEGDFNAGQMYEGVVYWLGKRYLSKFKKMEAQDIVKERVFNLDELSVLEQSAHEKFSVNKVLIPGRDIDRLTHEKDKSHDLSIRQINKYGLLKPETSKTLHHLEIRLHSQPSDEELTSPQNANKLYLYLDKTTNALSYAAINRNGIERKSIAGEVLTQNAKQEGVIIPPQSLESILSAITKEKAKSIDKLGSKEDKEAIIRFFASKGYAIEEMQTKILTKESIEAHDLINRDHRFIHLSFQEYLTAHSLVHQLKNNEGQSLAATARFVAEHKNEPRYLMTLKFMAGIITNEKNEQQTPQEQQKADLLVTRFWEAVTCNFDGALELGLETKVTLLMHLLEQGKIKGKDGEVGIDQRIPNLQTIKKLIDDVVLKDIIRWGETIITSGYVSESIATKLVSVIKQQEQQTASEQELKVAAEVIASIANKKELGCSKDALKLLTKLLTSGNWQIQKLGLEKMAQIMYRVTDKELLQDISDKTVQFVGDSNLGKYATLLLTRIITASPDLDNNIVTHLEQVLVAPEVNKGIKANVINSLNEIAKVTPNKAEGIVRALTALSADKTIGAELKIIVASSLSKIAKTKPELATKLFWILTTICKNEETEYYPISVEEEVAKSLSEVAKLLPMEDAFKILTSLLADTENYNHTEAAKLSLKEVIKANPDKADKAFESLVAMIVDEAVNLNVREAAVEVLSEVVRAESGLAEEAAQFLTMVLTDKKTEDGVKYEAVNSLSEIVKIRPELATKVFKTWVDLFVDTTIDDYIKSAAGVCLRKIAGVRPELAEEAFKALVILFTETKLADSCYKAGRDSISVGHYCFNIIKTMPANDAFKALTEVFVDKTAGGRVKALAAEYVDAAPEVAEKAFEVLMTLLLADETASSRTKSEAIRSLSKIVKAIPDKAQEVVKVLGALLAMEKEYKIHFTAVDSLSEVVDGRPDLAEEGVRVLATVLAYKRLTIISNDITAVHAKHSAERSLPKIVGESPQLAKEAIKALIPLLADKGGDPKAQQSVIYSIGEVVSSNPEVAEEVFKALATLLADEKSNPGIRETAARGLSRVVKAQPVLAEKVYETLIKFLGDQEINNNLREAAVFGLQESLKSSPKSVVKEILKAFITILSSEKADNEVKKQAICGLSEVAKANPELAEKILEAFITILSNEKADNEVKRQAICGLSEAARANPELAEEILEVLTGLLIREEVESRTKEEVAKSLNAVVNTIPNKAGEIIKVLEALLADERADSRARSAAVDALSTTAELVPSKAREIFEILITLLGREENADSNARYGDSIAQYSATQSLSKIIKAIPGESGEVAKILASLCAANEKIINSYTKKMDPNVKEGYIKEGHAKSLSIVVRVIQNKEGSAFKALVAMLTDEEASNDVKDAGSSSLGKIINAMPDKTEEAFKALATLLTDKKAANWVKQGALASLGKVVKVMPLNKSANLLKHDIPEVRNVVYQGLLDKLKFIASSSFSTILTKHEDMLSLIKIIEASKGIEEQQELNASAAQLLLRIAHRIEGSMVVWFNEHFDELLNLPETRECLKIVCHKTLSEGVITSIGKDFISKCIKDADFTSAIMPEASKIVFDGVTYDIKTTSTSMLHEIAQAVIEHSSDPLAEQYRNHTPIFNNSGSALPVAAADVEDMSIVDSYHRLSADKWQMSVMHLSDHKKTLPSKVFLLLETRDYAGRHIVCKISLNSEKGNFAVGHDTFVPTGITAGTPVTPEVRKEIFGEMKYEGTKPRYYGSKYKISKAEGEKLLAAAKAEEVGSFFSGDTSQYEAIRRLLVDSVFAETTETKAPQSLLLPWNEYALSERVINTDKLLDLTEHERQLRREGSLRIEASEEHDIRFDGHEKQLKKHAEALSQLRNEAIKALEGLQEKVDDALLSKQARAKIEKNMTELSQVVNGILGNNKASEQTLEEVIKCMQDLKESKEMSLERFSTMRQKIRDIEGKLKSTTVVFVHTTYDNELLNYPDIFIKATKAFGANKAIELGASLSPELLREALASNDNELFFAGAMSLGCEEVG